MLRVTLLLCFLGLVSGQASYDLNGALEQAKSEVKKAVSVGSTHDVEVQYVKRERHSFQDKMSNVDWSLASRKMVSGMITTFFRKSTLTDKERECMDEKVGEFVGDITGIVTDAVEAFQKVFGSKEKTHKSNLKKGIPYLLDGIARLTDLTETCVTLFGKAGKECLDASALSVLKTAGLNLKNFKWIESRLLVNGVSITEALADAVIDFEKERFSGFGENIGLALRQVALSTDNHHMKLPEGEATEGAIEKVSMGLSTGFFPRSSEMIITDVADSSVNIRVDLHQCVVDNQPLFRDIFHSVWESVAQMAANPKQHGFNSSRSSSLGQPMWIQELVIAFARLPAALTKCDLLDSETEDMLGDALQSMGSLRFDFKFPDDKVTTDQATEKVAYAIDRFSKEDYEGFGHELGKLFRELLLVVMPQKYSVDVSGRLVRNLEVPDILSEQQEKFSPMFIFGGVAFMFLMALVGMKSLRVLKGWQSANRDRELITVEAPENRDVEEILE